MNEFEAELRAPTVMVFPVNRVGRPLGAASSGTGAALPAGGTWSFETSTVDDPGVDAVAFASASLSP
ncbi:MAG TPA: hypothetical protein VGK73_14710 [Polyangiaceae bacterium]